MPADDNFTNDLDEIIESFHLKTRLFRLVFEDAQIKGLSSFRVFVEAAAAGFHVAEDTGRVDSLAVIQGVGAALLYEAVLMLSEALHRPIDEVITALVTNIEKGAR